ncbi:MAG: 50S ribosomal protein L10, partial [Acidimicrobiia bacterium]|nr:50S ribosomal protein L10 [Acidimicrobiia bacterium]
LNVAAMAELRRALSAAGGEYKIYKNTLVRFATRELGLELDDLLLGPTAIAFVDGDPVNIAKALRDFSRTNPALIIKGGLLGESVLDADGARALAEVEPREVLLAKLAGAMAAPMVQFAGLLQALPRNLAYGLQALIDQKGGAPEAPEPAEDGPAPTDEAAPAEDAAPAEEAAPAEDAPAPAEETPAAEEAPAASDETPAAEAADATQES